MRVTFSYPPGPRVVADVLDIGPDFIQLVEPGQRDGFGIYLHDEDWVTETGGAVRVHAIELGNEVRR